MVYVVNKATDMILNRCDAWEANSDRKMIAWAIENGYEVVDSEITFMGDMVIWVR